MQVNRVVAFALSTPALGAPWVLLFSHDVGLALLVLALPIGAAGVALSLRFYPARLLTARNGGSAEEVWDEWRDMLPIAGIIGGALALSTLVAAGVGLALGTGAASALIAVPVAFAAAAFCLLLGVLAGFITVLPVLGLCAQIAKAARGVAVDRVLLASSVLLLLAGVFAVALAVAVPGHRGYYAGRGGFAWLVLLTVLYAPADDVASAVALWIARGALLGVVGALVWVLAVQPKRTRRRRD